MWLSGVWLIVEIIGFIVLGASTIIWAVFGGAYYLSTMMVHSEDCSCNQCQVKRMRAWKRRHPNAYEPGKQAPNDPHPTQQWAVNEKNKMAPQGGSWMSTLELREGMRVLGKQSGSVYKIDDIVTRPYGIVVTLRNVITNKVSWVNVPSSNVSHRIWLVRPLRRKPQ